MTKRRLLIRNLFHFRAANLALIAGTVVATAVLTGALMVGDSVRGSLRDLALARLGPVDHVLVSNRFFKQDLAGRIQADSRFGAQFNTIDPVIQARGGVADESKGVRTGGVQIVATKDVAEAGQAVLNGELAEALNLQGTGADLVLSFPTPEETPRDATLAQRGSAEVLAALRTRVGRVEGGRSFLSLFNLAGSQRPPRNVWVRLNDLQSAIDQSNRVNALMVSAKPDAQSEDHARTLNAILKDVATLADYGLSLGKSSASPEAILGSASTYVPPAVDAAATQAAEALKIPLRRVSVYLGNTIERVSEGAASSGTPPTTRPSAIHYAILAGVSDVDGSPLAPDEVAVNQWTADRLGVKVGDAIRFTYYQRVPNGDLAEVSSTRLGAPLKVARVLTMAGLGADPSLTPEYKGLTDADSVSDWDPPAGVDIDKSLVTKEDEAYWDKYKAAPKVFLSLDTARKLWGNVYGDVNSIRVPADKAEAFAAELLKRIDPATVGLAFQPIKAQQLAASTGSTDFSGLFVGFSFFLLVSAAMLVAMLFRLAVEQRARQYGLMGALGFTPKDVRRLVLAEGAVLATVGGLLGVLAAVGYAWLMLAGLRTWWLSAIGTTAMELHVAPMTLAIGFVASLLIALLAGIWGIRRVTRAEAAALLAGGFSRSAAASRPGATGPLLGAISFLMGLIFVLIGVVKPEYAKLSFLAGGTILLVASLCGVSAKLQNVRRDAVAAAGAWSLSSLGTRNAGRNRGRSVLTVGLIAFASFILITLSTLKAPPQNLDQPKSGTGGYDLILTSDVPLLGDLNSPKGRDVLGVQDTNSPLWRQADFLSFRTWAGQDMSCLNLTRPSVPTILGVPQALQETERFKFVKSIQHTDNGWKLLSLDTGDADVIPVIADAEAATYILKLGLGESLAITDQTGRQRKLKLVATLDHSIFQSELLMSEANFLRLFPTQSGFGTVLVDTVNPSESRGDASATTAPVAKAVALPELSRFLSTELADFSVTIEPTATRLARYQEVQNTYISTFQTLGAFGLLLGTVGLAVVLLRSLIERRPELALLTALGFTPRSRVTLVLAENVYLLIMGLLVGAGCALLGILPAVISASRSINLPELLGTLLLVLLSGLVVLTLTVFLGNRHITPADLRVE